MWLREGDSVTWTLRKKDKDETGEIIAILEPGEMAEDRLDENERTRISTRNIGDKITPVTRRALVKVTDKNGYVTYHTPKLSEVRMTEKEKSKATVQTLCVKRDESNNRVKKLEAAIDRLTIDIRE